MTDYSTTITTPAGQKSAQNVLSTPHATSFTDRSVGALSAQQAAGTAPILGANPSRTSLKIVPRYDSVLKIAANAISGIPLYGWVENTFTGSECPANELFIEGQVGQPVVIWEG